MTRTQALEISDALVEAGLSHTIAVAVIDKMIPRETWRVDVKPILSYEPTDITRLQRIADKFDCQIGYVQGTFHVRENK